MDQNNGLQFKTCKEETRPTLTIDLQEISPRLIRISLQGQTAHMGTTVQITGDHMINAQINHSIEVMEIDPEMDLLTIKMGTGKKKQEFSGSPSTQRRDFSQNKSYRQPRSDHPKSSALRRSATRPTNGFTPYEQKFPRNNNRTSSNVVRFTTTDNTNNNLSDLCLLNYKSLRIPTPTSLEIQD